MNNVIHPEFPLSPSNLLPDGRGTGAPSLPRPGASAPFILDATAKILARAQARLDNAMVELERMARDLSATSRRVQRMIDNAKEHDAD